MGHYFPRNRLKAIDYVAAERSLQFDLGWFAEPIFKTGNWNEIMRKTTRAVGDFENDSGEEGKNFENLLCSKSEFSVL